MLSVLLFLTSDLQVVWTQTAFAHLISGLQHIVTPGRFVKVLCQSRLQSEWCLSCTPEIRFQSLMPICLLSTLFPQVNTLIDIFFRPSCRLWSMLGTRHVMCMPSLLKGTATRRLRHHRSVQVGQFLNATAEGHFLMKQLLYQYDTIGHSQRPRPTNIYSFPEAGLLVSYNSQSATCSARYFTWSDRPSH